MLSTLKILCCLAMVFIGHFVQAQVNTAECQKKLKLATIAYETGRLNDLDSLLQDCLKVHNHKIKVEAYKLLFMASIWTDQPKKSKLYLRKFRRLMPGYRPKMGEHKSPFDEVWLEYASRKKK